MRSADCLTLLKQVGRRQTKLAADGQKTAIRVQPPVNIQAVRHRPEAIVYSIEQLRASLRDPGQRIATLQALLRQPETISPLLLDLLDLTDQPDEELAAWVDEALEAARSPLPEDIAEFESRVADSRSETAAFWAATMLGRLAEGRASTVAVLAKAAGAPDRALETRQRAAWALQHMSQARPEDAEALQRAAAESDPRLRRMAQAALRTLVIGE